MIHEDNFYIHALRSPLSYDSEGGGGGVIYAPVYADTSNGARTTDGPQNHFEKEKQKKNTETAS
jgi:hypothetical protein